MGFVAESGFEGLAHTLPTQAHPPLRSCQCLTSEELSSPHTVSAVERCHPFLSRSLQPHLEVPEAPRGWYLF